MIRQTMPSVAICQTALRGMQDSTPRVELSPRYTGIWKEQFSNNNLNTITPATLYRRLRRLEIESRMLMIHSDGFRQCLVETALPNSFNTIHQETYHGRVDPER